MQNSDEVLSKVPEVTLGFWIIKILATTLGETGGDLVTMGWLHADQNAQNGGYLIGTAIFFAVFVAAVIVQIFDEAVQRLDLLAGHCGLDDGWHGDGRPF
ncbi:putative membrane-anchored protein [Bradyrhizobium sp. LB7.1]